MDKATRCGAGEGSLTEFRSAGELYVWGRPGWGEGGDAGSEGTMGLAIGMVGSVGDFGGGAGGCGDMGDSGPNIFKSEMLLARRPRPLGGRISGDGGDGDRLGVRGHGTLERC
jgi:hypothetical protein